MELLGATAAELSSFCEKLGHSSFRGRQIADWIYKKGVRETAQMTNLPDALRGELSESASLTRSDLLDESTSPDGARKFLLKLADGETIESVLLPYVNRTSVCVSTQIGCAAGCVFCATADCGFVRNLTAGEMVDQVLTLQEQGGSRVTHVVFMGMGEPLLNFDNVVKAIRLLNEQVGIGMRRLTISTVGIAPAIRKLMELGLQLTLAISLHAPDQSLRNKLIPISTKSPMDDLITVCRDYANATKRRITFEYLLLAGVNDTPHHASALADLLKHTLCNVNLIPYNEVEGKPFARPTRQAIRAFRSVLAERGIEVTQRVERGHSVAGACGQLRRRRLSEDNGVVPGHRHS